MKTKRVILWFRQDLRLHDNPALFEALRAGDEVYPVYVFDERVFCLKTPKGFAKTGVHRSLFILESVKDLRENLRACGSDLIVGMGRPEEIIFTLARDLKSSWVFCNRERTQEEVLVQDRLEEKLWTIGQELRFSRGKMLYFTGDLPFPITHIPNQLIQFKKEVEKIVPIRAAFEKPEFSVTGEEDFSQAGKIPELQEFGMERPSDGDRSFEGGESSGLRKLAELARTQSEDLGEAKMNGVLLMEQSISRLSPYLAQGCLSPRKVYFELLGKANSLSTEPPDKNLFYRLMKRDFLRFMAKKHGNKIFQPGGSGDKLRTDLTDDEHLFGIWKTGETGVPIIDAGMRQLNKTGFISNLSRRLCGHFLVNHLLVNWRWGAEYFESQLIDYDPCSNWVNWNYIAGVAKDQAECKALNYSFYAKKYDPIGNYVKYWLPVLRKLPPKYIHEPHILDNAQQNQYHVVLGDNYPDSALLQHAVK